MLEDIPFSYRVAALLSLMAIVAGVERFRYGAKATRFREYGFILFSGAVGSLVASVTDLATSSISPEYFSLGKGLAVEGLSKNAFLLGVKTGFSAGVIGGAIVLFAAGARRPGYRRLSFQLWIPIVAAIAAGVLLPLVASGFDPVGYASQLKELLSGEQLRRFRVVWWAHTGAYLGLVSGVLCIIIDNRRRYRGFKAIDVASGAGSSEARVP